MDQAARSNWIVYCSARDAQVAAREEANSAGVIQYVIKSPAGFIVTPNNSGDPSAVSYLPLYGLNYRVKGRLPRELTAVDISEIEMVARSDPTEDFYRLLAARMYRLSPADITDQHIYAVKQEVARIKDGASLNSASDVQDLKII
jgi:hypothetical protein